MILAFRSWATSSILDSLPWSISPFEYHSAIACITSWRIDADWPWQRKRENSKTVVHRQLPQQVACVTCYRYSWHKHSGKALNQWMAHDRDNNYYFVTEIIVLSGACIAPQCRPCWMPFPSNFMYKFDSLIITPFFQVRIWYSHIFLITQKHF